MKTKKPDIFLGITMCMLVLAAVLCIVILFVTKSKSNPTPADTGASTNEVLQSNENTGTPDNTGNSGGGTTPVDTKPVTPSVELKDIDEIGLRSALNDSLRGLTSEWQVMVIDPAKDVRVGSAVNCGVEDWMTANRMTQVFIMGAVFQQGQDSTLVIDDVLDDVKAMINKNDTYAADRLTEKLGGGDAAKGREAVKAFAVANGVKLGYNRSLTGSSEKKNYVSAQQTAQLLNLICQGKLVSEAASRQMLEILLTPAEGEAQMDHGVTGDNVRMGFIDDVEENICICTMGVVELSNRSFVVSVVCNKPVTTDGAKKKLAELISIAQPFFAE